MRSKLLEYILHGVAIAIILSRLYFTLQKIGIPSGADAAWEYTWMPAIGRNPSIVLDPTNPLTLRSVVHLLQTLLYTYTPLGWGYVIFVVTLQLIGYFGLVKFLKTIYRTGTYTQYTIPVAALIYVENPMIGMFISVGHKNVLLGYVLLPWILYYLMNLENIRALLWLVTLASVYASAVNPVMIPISLLAIVVMLPVSHHYCVDRSKWLRNLAVLVVSTIALAALAYWRLIAIGSPIIQQTFRFPLSTYVSYSHTSTLYAILAVPKPGAYTYTPWLQELGIKTLVWSLEVILAIMALALIRYVDDVKRYVEKPLVLTTLAVVAVVTIPLSLGPNAPGIGNYLLYLAATNPVASGLRTAMRWSFLAQLTYTSLIPLAVISITEVIGKQFRLMRAKIFNVEVMRVVPVALTITVLVVATYLAIPFIVKGIELLPIPRTYLEAGKRVTQAPVLVIPVDAWMRYYGYPVPNVGALAIGVASKNITTQNTLFGRLEQTLYIENLLREGRTRAFVNLVKSLGVKYILDLRPLEIKHKDLEIKYRKQVTLYRVKPRKSSTPIVFIGTYRDLTKLLETNWFTNYTPPIIRIELGTEKYLKQFRDTILTPNQVITLAILHLAITKPETALIIELDKLAPTPRDVYSTKLGIWYTYNQPLHHMEVLMSKVLSNPVSTTGHEPLVTTINIEQTANYTVLALVHSGKINIILSIGNVEIKQRTLVNTTTWIKLGTTYLREGVHRLEIQYREPTKVEAIALVQTKHLQQTLHTICRYYRVNYIVNQGTYRIPLRVGTYILEIETKGKAQIKIPELNYAINLSTGNHRLKIMIPETKTYTLKVDATGQVTASLISTTTLKHLEENTSKTTTLPYKTPKVAIPNLGLTQEAKTKHIKLPHKIPELAMLIATTTLLAISSTATTPRTVTTAFKKFREEVRPYLRQISKYLQIIDIPGLFIVAFMALLISAAIHLAIGKEARANQLATYAYYCLVIGVIGRLIELIYQERKERKRRSKT